jgi:hypothetical protein
VPNLSTLSLLMTTLFSVITMGSTDPLNWLNEYRTLGSDPGVADTLYIDSVHVVMPEQIFLPVYFTNDEPLVALEVTLRHNSPDLVMDTFLFDNGRAASLPLTGSGHSDTALTCYALITDGPSIPPGSGLLGVLVMSYATGTDPQFVEVDTTKIVDSLIEHATYFTIEGISSFTPQVSPGFVSLQLTCCFGRTGNVDGDPDNLVDIGDLTALIHFLYSPGQPHLECEADANIDGSTDGVVDIGDLTALISYLYIAPGALQPALCP